MAPPSESKAENNVQLVVVPDDFADQDRIGHQVHSEALAEMIRSVKSKGSFTIGVYGQWGHGKTSMLRQIMSTISGVPRQGRAFTYWTIRSSWGMLIFVPYDHSCEFPGKEVMQKSKRLSLVGTNWQKM